MPSRYLHTKKDQKIKPRRRATAVKKQPHSNISMLQISGVYKHALISFHGQYFDTS